MLLITLLKSSNWKHIANNNKLSILTTTPEYKIYYLCFSQIRQKRSGYLYTNLLFCVRLKIWFMYLLTNLGKNMPLDVLLSAARVAQKIACVSPNPVIVIVKVDKNSIVLTATKLPEFETKISLNIHGCASLYHRRLIVDKEHN